MNWFEHMEQKRKLLIGGTTIICLTLLAVTTRRFNISYDSFWHLQMGLDWLENGDSLWQDHFSFTFKGADIASPPYVFEVSLAWLVTQFGLESGFEVFKLGAFILAFGLVTFFLRKLRSPVVVYCLVLPLLVVLLQFRSIVRPELIGYSFSILAMMLYYRARSGMSLSNMLPIVALMLVWGNYHTPIFGYIIFFGFFLDLALQQIHDRADTSTWLQWLGWGLAVVAVGFLQPGFNHYLIQMFFFDPAWKNLIQEYQSSNYYLPVAAIYSLIGLTLVTMLLTLRNRRFGLFIICVLLTYFSVTMARLVTPSGIVILCIFTWMVSEIDPLEQLQKMPKGLVLGIGGTAMVLFTLTMSTAVNRARTYMDQNRFSQAIFPVDIADYMVEQGISGRIFNEYSAGGYLIYRLSPDSKVYIDGRTGILYPIDHYYRLLAAGRSSEVLRAEIDKYDINLAVLKNYRRNYALVRDTGILGLDYASVRFSLFRRDNPNFPVLGTLLAYPTCWNAEMISALEEEQKKAEELLPRDSFLLPLVQFVIDYTKSNDRSSFLSDLAKNRPMSLAIMRFTAYQALVQNLDSMADELFSGITEMEFGDYLGSGLSKIRLGEWKTAEQLLDRGTRVTSSENLTEIKILHGLLTHIRQNQALELFDDEYINRLGEDVGASSDPNSFSVPDINSFCPDS